LVPLGTVLRVSIQPNYDLYVKDLKLDPKLFRRREVTGDHVPGISVYVNDETGILYEVRGEGRVYSIEYSESEKTCKMLERRASRNKRK
ncbi:MAG TPA: hypothetical protein VK400_17465, partial [Pyrinomonadaceae bacterium]|nr:hypothetical protein [Pyrinomonadaceae bacterium]